MSAEVTLVVMFTTGFLIGWIAAVLALSVWGAHE